MSTLGKMFQKPFIHGIKNLIFNSRIKDEYQFIYRNGLGLLPVVAASTISAYIAPYIVLFMVYVLYKVNKEIIPILEKSDSPKAQYLNMTFVYTYLTIWGFLLYKIDNINQLGTVLGSMLLLLIAITWPFLGSQKKIKQRFKHFKNTYTTASFIVVIHQISIIYTHIRG